MSDGISDEATRSTGSSCSSNDVGPPSSDAASALSLLDDIDILDEIYSEWEPSTAGDVVSSGDELLDDIYLNWYAPTPPASATTTEEVPRQPAKTPSPQENVDDDGDGVIVENINKRVEEKDDCDSDASDSGNNENDDGDEVVKEDDDGDDVKDKATPSKRMDGSVSECIMREAFKERCPKETIIKTRKVLWLHGLEFDAYCERLRIAMEYQGGQHAKFVKWYHRTMADFYAQQARDERKRQACLDNGVTLIEIGHTTTGLAIRRRVNAELDRLGYASVELVSDEEFLKRVEFFGAHAAVMLKKMQDYAAKLKGRCLSPEYLGYNTPLLFECEYKHRFLRTPKLNRADGRKPHRLRFCRACSGTERWDEEKTKQAMMGTGYELISIFTRRSEAGKSIVWIEFKCPDGLTHKADRANFFPVVDGKPHRGCGCGRIKNNRATGAAIREEHASNGGVRCLEPFAKRNVKTKWQCLVREHTFTASWGTINDRHPYKCLECKKIEDAAAKARGDPTSRQIAMRAHKDAREAAQTPTRR